jgi:DNA-binding transcriptional ArsR family regulator
MKNTKSKSGKGATLTLTGAGKEGVVVNFDTIKQAALVIRAVNHPIRKKMLEVISLNDGITVTEIYVKLKIEQSVASQHLAILRSAEVVNTSREGKFIHYHINGKRMATLAGVVDKLASE